MELLSFLLQTSRKIMILAVLAAIVSGLGMFGVLVFVRRCLWHSDGHLRDPAFIWGFAAAAVGAVAAHIISQALLLRLSRRAVTRLTLHLGEQVLATPLERLEELGVVRLQATFTHDVHRIRKGLDAIPRLYATLVLLGACLAFLSVLSFPFFLAVLAFLAVGLVVQWLLGLWARQQRGPVKEGQEELLGQFRHLVEGVQELKIHRPRRQAFLQYSLKGSVELQEKQGWSGRFSLILSKAWARLLFFGLIGFILVGVPGVLEAEPGIKGLYVIAVLFLRHPVASCVKLLPNLKRSQRSLRRIRELGASLASPPAEPAAEPAPLPPWTRLELVGITHRYQGERGPRKGFTLGPIDMVFRPGEVVFLGGDNGSGKTTLVKVLSGLYAPLAGEIRLDGREITASQMESYRQLFSVVFSRYHHFPELVGVGCPDLEKRVQEYLVRLQLEDKVKIRHGAVTAPRLSLGQRKRVALLVAYLDDRPFYIFDEWAADQDPPFRHVFYTELLPDLKARGKAVLVITHDDRYRHLADHIYFLKDGQLCEPTCADGVPVNGNGASAAAAETVQRSAQE
jgi:putative ATP-binding cassette transporter